MNKYYRKLILLIAVCALGALLVIMTNGGKKITILQNRPSEVVLEEEKNTQMLAVSNETERHALILYEPSDFWSDKYKKNLQIVLEHMRIRSEELELSRSDTVSYQDYDLVILAASRWNEMADPMNRLTEYVEDGGALFVGMLPEDTKGQFGSVYRKFGIIDYGDYLDYDNLSFQEELVPGIRNMEFSGEDFSDVCLSVTVEDSARIYAVTEVNGREQPLIWRYDCGKGTMVFFNGTGMSGDFWRGIAAGCINALFDTNMYPVINALCLFIDDFPSPQYESTSNVVRKDYNRSVKEFYRDIWWPDMQTVAEKYGDIYTGLFIATYNNVVNPDKFTYDEPSMEQYYGNSLLRGGHEMGAHGYNHQSLTLKGGTPESMEYRPWANTEDMAASIEELMEIASDLFPGYTIRTYVPPSNYLSSEGREAVKEAIPDLKVISGIYTNEAEEGEVYAQDFEMAEDGIAEFPRVTAGMLQNDFERLSAVSAMGMYGVFSHFIHPDDIFDEERGKNQNWETLYEAYCEMMEWVHETYPFLRSLSASEAADALKAYDEVVPRLDIREDEIEGSLENFCGESFFYLKTDKDPQAVDESCTVEKIDGKNGSLYYLVTVKEANFRIKLVNT